MQSGLILFFSPWFWKFDNWKLKYFAVSLHIFFLRRSKLTISFSFSLLSNDRLNRLLVLVAPSCYHFMRNTIYYLRFSVTFLFIEKTLTCSSSTFFLSSTKQPFSCLTLSLLLHLIEKRNSHLLKKLLKEKKKRYRYMNTTVSLAL